MNWSWLSELDILEDEGILGSGNSRSNGRDVRSRKYK